MTTQKEAANRGTIPVDGGGKEKLHSPSEYSTQLAPIQVSPLSSHLKSLLDQAEAFYIGTGRVEHLAMVGHFAGRLAEVGE